MNKEIFYVLTGVTWGLFILIIALKWIWIVKIKQTEAWNRINQNHIKEDRILSRFENFRNLVAKGNGYTIVVCSIWYFASSSSWDITLLIVNTFMFLGIWIFWWWVIPPPVD